MKKVLFLSEESIFSGHIKCGIAEVVDSLAVSLADEYEVFVVCINDKSTLARTFTDFEILENGVEKAKFLKVNYYLIKKEFWPRKAIEIIDVIKPDILHSFSEPDIITKLKYAPKKSVYTFDDINFLIGKEKFLRYYNSITTFSKGYADYIMKMNNSVTIELSKLNFKRISIGVLEDFFSPSRGLLLPAEYNAYDQLGKEKSRKRIKEKYNIPQENFVCLTMCRLVKEKGIDDIIQAIPDIKDLNCTLLIIGKGLEYYEEKLLEQSKQSNIIFIKNLGEPFQICPIAAGCDFYLQPSLMETGGLMPMTMSLYGTIPIVTQNGGLADNFNEENAIIVRNNDVFSSLKKAAEIYNNPIKLEEKRRICMTQDFSWSKRKQEFINLYEAI